MRLRSDGLLEATSFAEHMAPDVRWIDDPAFAAAFGKELTTMTDVQAGWTEPGLYPGYVNMTRGIDGDAATVTVRETGGDGAAGITARLTMPAAAAQQWLLEALVGHDGAGRLERLLRLARAEAGQVGGAVDTELVLHNIDHALAALFRGTGDGGSAAP